VRINTRKGPVFIFEDTENLEIDGFKTGTVDANAPTIELRQVKTASIDGRRDGKADGTFVRISGDKTIDISLGEKIMRTKGAVIVEADVSKDALIQNQGKMKQR